MNKSILLHCCCAPCMAYPLESLLSEWDVVCYFSNSNIYPEAEYKKRFNELKKVEKLNKVEVISDSYDHKAWLKEIKGLENEPERGKRCRACFEFRLRRSFEFAKSRNIKYITSTLTVSPYKDSAMLFEVADKLGREYGVTFECYDFKKKDGYLKTKKLSEDYGLYMQDYCGCEFSFKELRREENR